MAGLLNMGGTGNANQFWGDALYGLGRGLLNYSSNRNPGQAGLAFGDAMQQAQAQREAQDYKKVQQRLLEIGLENQKRQQAQQAAEDAQKQQALQAYKTLVGGNVVGPNGPQLPSAPSPMVQGLPQNIQALLPAMSPEQGMQFLSDYQTKQLAGGDVPTVKDFYEGGNVIQKQWNPQTRSWDEIGKGPRWAPQQNQTFPKLSLNPTYFRDADGNLQIGQLGMDGQLHAVPLPQGSRLAPGISQVDTGTGIAILDNKSGAQVNSLEKDVAGTERDKAEGKAQGEATTALPDITAKADDALKLIDDIQQDPYRKMATGMSSWTNLVPGTKPYDFKQKVDQLKGKSFLEAFNSLRGGGQITEVEGKKATDAIARLDTAQTEEGFMQALNDLKSVIEAGKKRAAQKAGQSPAEPPQDAPQRLKYNPETGELE